MKINLLDILGIVFIVLKLSSIITWSWWWVLAPFWVYFILVFIVLLYVEMNKKK